MITTQETRANTCNITRSKTSLIQASVIDRNSLAAQETFFKRLVLILSQNPLVRKIPVRSVSHGPVRKIDYTKQKAIPKLLRKHTKQWVR